MVLETAPDGPPTIVAPEELVRLYEQTRDFWRTWIGRSTSTSTLGSDRQPSSSASVSSPAHSSTGLTSAATGPSGSTR